MLCFHWSPFLFLPGQCFWSCCCIDCGNWFQCGLYHPDADTNELWLEADIRKILNKWWKMERISENCSINDEKLSGLCIFSHACSHSWAGDSSKIAAPPGTRFVSSNWLQPSLMNGGCSPDLWKRGESVKIRSNGRGCSLLSRFEGNRWNWDYFTVSVSISIEIIGRYDEDCEVFRSSQANRWSQYMIYAFLFHLIHSNCE